jgi:cardiolipin synthase
VIDQRWAMIGSANMDVRSFRLNFEVTSILYDNSVAQELQVEFDQLRAESRRIRERDIAAWSYPQVMSAGIARLAAPIL